MVRIMLTPCLKCIKYSLFAFCLIAWILGLTTFIIGIIARVSGSFGPLDYHIPAVHAGANLLIAVGLFIMMIGFLGCCGAIRESQCLLFSFFLAVFFCFTLLMAAGLWAVAWQSKLSFYLYSYLEKLVQEYDEFDKDNENNKLIDWIQDNLTCCGVNSAADFVGKPIPKSCGNTPPAQLGRVGCYHLLLEKGKNNLDIICGIGIGFAVIMVIGMVFSMMLCCALRESS